LSDVSPIRLIGREPLASIGQPQVPLAKRPDFDLAGTRVYPSRLLLEGPTSTLPLERRVMEVLLAFVDANGAVLSRDELMERCWPGVVVGDDAVHRVIGGLRKAAAATGGSFVIETIPRIGYRLKSNTSLVVAPARETTEGAETLDSPQPVASTTPEPPRVSRRWLLAGGGAALLSAGGLAWWTSRAPTANPASAQLVAQARIALRPGMPAKDREAIALIERALAIAPDDAAAWGLLALAHARAEQHAAPDLANPATALIDEAAQRALALDPANADARAALALAIPYFGDWLAAERRFDAVLADHPGHVILQDARLFLLGTVGRLRESGLARVAVAPSAPFDANMQYGLIYGLWFLGRIEEADRVASRAMEMWPGHYGVWFARVWLLAGTRRYNRALDQIDDAAARPALPPPVIATLRAAIAAADTKQPAAVGAAVDQVMAGVSRSVAAVVNAMMLLNHLGAIDHAFDLARAYYLEQGPILAALSWRPGQPVIRDQRRRKTNMLFTPTAAAMRSDPRFMPLMQQMGLADYWDQRGIRPDFLQ
jgi:DNA-binding winged helix-turn-helix (wHTH) protein/tetratricopeptide (TPR) repeat protein